MKYNGETVLLIVIVSFNIASSLIVNGSFKHSEQYFITRNMLKGYSKQDPPMLDKSTKVLLGIHINSIYSISEQNMDYAVNLYLKQTWQDPRLTFSPTDEKLQQMKMEDSFWKRLWVPDVFFRNEKRAVNHEVTVPNRLVRINSTGHIWYTTKITATLSCPMDLRKYPLDVQRCPMMFESFGYQMDTMHFQWLDGPNGPVYINNSDVQLPQFTLGVPKTMDCSKNYTTGNFSCLSIEFILRRDIGYFIIQVYVPSILIVILSWVSFWINIDASPARVSLGLLTVLTTTTMSGSARESLPRVSYMKAIDIWMIVCLTFVFASLIEYAVVNVISRHQLQPLVQWRVARAVLSEKRKTSCLQRRKNNGKDCDKVEIPFKTPADAETNKRHARAVDKISRKCFPIAFVLFNTIYWITYTIYTG